MARGLPKASASSRKRGDMPCGSLKRANPSTNPVPHRNTAAKPVESAHGNPLRDGLPAAAGTDSAAGLAVNVWAAEPAAEAPADPALISAFPLPVEFAAAAGLI